jgi:hypothetical protein
MGTAVSLPAGAVIVDLCTDPGAGAGAGTHRPDAG